MFHFRGKPSILLLIPAVLILHESARGLTLEDLRIIRGAHDERLANTPIFCEFEMRTTTSVPSAEGTVEYGPRHEYAQFPASQYGFGGMLQYNRGSYRTAAAGDSRIRSRERFTSQTLILQGNRVIAVEEDPFKQRLTVYPQKGRSAAKPILSPLHFLGFPESTSAFLRTGVLEDRDDTLRVRMPCSDEEREIIAQHTGQSVGFWNGTQVRDPDKGFLLKRMEYHVACNEDSIGQALEVLEWREIAEDTFFPTHLIRTYSGPGMGIYKTEELKVTRLEIDARHFDTSVFFPSFNPGTLYYDYRYNAPRRIGEDGVVTDIEDLIHDGKD